MNQKNTDQLSKPLNKDWTLLVVDDHFQSRQLLIDIIDFMGLKSIPAENGLDAIKKTQDHQVDLILLDIMMPEMDGMEFLEKRRGNNELYKIPVVVISAVNQIDTLLKCIQIGADDYLVKPFSPLVLRARIQNLLDKRSFFEQQSLFLQKVNQTDSLLDSIIHKEQALTNLILKDLNTPLSEIKKRTKNIENTLTGDQTSFHTISETVQGIGSSISQMENIVNLLLDLTKIENDNISIEYKHANLFSLLNDIIENLKHKTHQNIEFNINTSDKDISLSIDYNLFIKAISTLINEIVRLKSNLQEVFIEIEIQNNNYVISFQSRMDSHITEQKIINNFNLYYCKKIIQVLNGSFTHQISSHNHFLTFYIHFSSPII